MKEELYRVGINILVMAMWKLKYWGDKELLDIIPIVQKVTGELIKVIII